MTETPLKFKLGRIVITRNALDRLHPEDLSPSLSRHAGGDWGDCYVEDIAENDLSLQQGFRLMSVYQDRTGEKFWIITEADRSATTILLPEDY